MSSIDVIVKSKVKKSFRVKQLESIFDLPQTKTIEHRWTFDENLDEKEWNIGLFVGPSGSGKSVLLKKMFPKNYHKEWSWTDRAIVDDIENGHKIQDIVSIFSSVGFSSPPSWLKSYKVLSNGERFRVDLARCILNNEDMFVYDEFSSVVDRDVAKITSLAVSKTLRKYKRKMIAASCHYDIIKWLRPDWVYDLRDNKLTRRRHRRPEIRLNIHEIPREYWQVFKNYHYLSGNQHIAAKCYGAYWYDNLVAFCSLLAKAGFKGWRRIHRIVVLPDYQGVGIGQALMRAVGDIVLKQGLRMSITSSHPSIMRGLEKKMSWRLMQFYKEGSVAHSKIKSVGMSGRHGTILASYEYINDNSRQNS